MTTNWQDLPAGSELDGEIAQRLGMTYVIVPPHNVRIWANRGGYYMGDSVPRYSTDLNIAFQILSIFTYFEINTTENPGEIKCVITHNNHDGIARADTVALAICRAWLDWKDQTES